MVTDIIKTTKDKNVKGGSDMLCDVTKIKKNFKIINIKDKSN